VNRPVTIRQVLLAGALVLVTALSWAKKPRETEGLVIQDLPYGQVLYEYYKEDYFNALTRLLVEEHFERIPDHAAEAELLLGGLYLSYGLHEQATDIFERLLATEESDVVRHRAWFFLGKVLFQRGYLKDADKALQRAGDALPEHLLAERGSLRAQIDIETGKLGAAKGLVDEWQLADDWAAYAAYNLGVALIRENRLPEAVSYLEQIGQMEVTSEELRGLRDRANLALGFAWLREENGEQAKIALERIRLSGPFSNAALLGYGWAEAASGNYREALVPWMELRERQEISPAFQESLLAIPYAYRKLNANQQAAAGYDDAIAVYDAEIAQLDGAIAAARSGALIRSLLNADVTDFSRWNWQLGQLPDTAESRYLYEVIATHEFQTGLRNYRDLMMLAGHLDGWHEKLDIYDHMIAARRLSYARSAETFPDDYYGADVAAYRDDYIATEARLRSIEQQRDVIALGTDTEQRSWETIARLEQGGVLDAADDSAIAKLALFKGVLLWDMDRDYKYRLWQQQNKLAELESVVADLEQSQQRFSAEVAAVPVRLDEFADRAAELDPQIGELSNRVVSITELQIKALGEIAANELQQQKERLKQYRAQARFAQASILDQSASADGVVQ